MKEHSLPLLISDYAAASLTFGQPVDLRGPRAANAAGIRTAFQEMTLIPRMTVTQNVLLSYEPTGYLGQIRRRALNGRVEALLASLDMSDVDPERDVSEFDLSVRQKIEIAKALALDPKYCCSTNRPPRYRARMSIGSAG